MEENSLLVGKKHMSFSDNSENIILGEARPQDPII